MEVKTTTQLLRDLRQEMEDFMRISRSICFCLALTIVAVIVSLLFYLFSL